MVRLTEEMRQFIKEHGPAYIATANKEGISNVSPKGSIQVVDDNTMAFACIWSAKTIENLEENPQVAVVVADVKAIEGFQFKGETTLEKSGDLFDQMSKTMVGMKLPRPNALLGLPFPKYTRCPLLNPREEVFR